MSSRTHPHIKWLINEAAALSGELERIDLETAALARRRAEVSRAHEACTQVLACMTVPQPELVLPTVRVHRDYGGRGELVKFIRTLLQDSYPQRFTALEIATHGAEAFGLKFRSTEDVSKLSADSVGRALRKLQAAGAVERFTDPHYSKGPVVHWRWRVLVLTLDIMRREAEDAGCVKPGEGG